MNILVPKTITPEMFMVGTTIPEVDATVGEVAWASGSDAAVGLRRVWKGYAYECVKAVAGAPANTYEPGTPNAATFWERDEGAPASRMAPFDKYLFTKARRATSLTYVLRPGFVNGLALYGLEADKLTITVKADGVDLMPPVNAQLWEQAFGEWEYLFGDLQRGTYFVLKDLPIHPGIEISITVARNNAGVEAAVGFISVGNWKQLLLPGRERMGGAQYGVEASTRDYSYVDDRKDGTYTEVQGRLATNINLSCVIDAVQAPAAKTLLDQILGKAVAIEVSDLPRYGHLATVGKVTGTVRSTDWTSAQVDLQIKGNV
ncbi:hypothetical protein DR66_5954 [Delftia acidovorans]|uniref:hypothetical protein n=1 Tax=Delftia acidovorans TaxID=80866 RepID=UPI0005015111|nr:hypothetical protein [Delftia acidovorans]KFJ08869.1 hypothetical protein DR66_5954 [Delftia acidovorans]QQB48331.1 hypothetical protein I6H54_18275 [Delftia acidovorans]